MLLYQCCFDFSFVLSYGKTFDSNLWRVWSFQTVVLGILMRSIGNKNTILLGLGFQILQLAWYGFGSQPWSVPLAPWFARLLLCGWWNGFLWSDAAAGHPLLCSYLFIFCSPSPHAPFEPQAHNEMSFVGPRIDFWKSLEPPSASLIMHVSMALRGWASQKAAVIEWECNVGKKDRSQSTPCSQQPLVKCTQSPRKMALICVIKQGVHRTPLLAWSGITC